MRISGSGRSNLLRADLHVNYIRLVQRYPQPHSQLRICTTFLGNFFGYRWFPITLFKHMVSLKMKDQISWNRLAPSVYIKKQIAVNGLVVHFVTLYWQQRSAGRPIHWDSLRSHLGEGPVASTKIYYETSVKWRKTFMALIIMLFHMYVSDK